MDSKKPTESSQSRKNFFIYLFKYNVSVSNITLNVIYNKNSVLSGRQRAWKWPNKGRNMSAWQYTIFIV